LSRRRKSKRRPKNIIDPAIVGSIAVCVNFPCKNRLYGLPSQGGRHDAHSGVTCQACHLDGVAPLRDTETKAVRWEKTTKPGIITTIHDMPVSDDDTACVSCHFSRNQVGAASMILPPKSILCMPCHGATFSVGDTTTITTLLVFLVGLVLLSSLWLSGSVAGADSAGSIGKIATLSTNTVKTVFSAKSIQIIKALFFDVLLQRRLFRRSVNRWVIHGLIFFPFVIRFVWGMVGLFTSIWLPERSIAWSLLDKNNPAAAFLFDLTGIMILLGVIFAFLRDSASRADRPPGLPARDRWALGLIGGIVGIGFILEAMRIAMTGWPSGSGYAVIGYVLSKLLSGMSGLVDIYGYVWYIHAVLTGAFIAYLPFSRLMHIIMAPVVLAMNAATDHGLSRK
jgi:nitrate reductase gamma subunit